MPLDPTKEGGTVLEQFAKSEHGRRIYHLQEDGFSIAETQAEMTPLQETVYMVAKSYWSNKEQEEAKNSSSTPSPSKNGVSQHF